MTREIAEPAASGCVMDLGISSKMTPVGLLRVSRLEIRPKNVDLSMTLTFELWLPKSN